MMTPKQCAVCKSEDQVEFFNVGNLCGKCLAIAKSLGGDIAKIDAQGHEYADQIFKSLEESHKGDRELIVLPILVGAIASHLVALVYKKMLEKVDETNADQWLHALAYKLTSRIEIEGGRKREFFIT
jgi:fructose-1-phosphate kinase PfkB-like protein